VSEDVLKPRSQLLTNNSMVLFMALSINSVNWPNTYLNNYTLPSAEHIPGSSNWKTFFCFVLLNSGFQNRLVKNDCKKSVLAQFHSHFSDG